eukprot:Hpha_TRINITY_DN15759_c0_g3::TRINITY_DN15759_c0_g3_i8::g.37999::m.37999
MLVGFLLAGLGAGAPVQINKTCGVIGNVTWAAPPPDKAENFVPQLIGVSCMKCGTSALHEYLKNAKGFQAASVKEVHYFMGQGHCKEDHPRVWGPSSSRLLKKAYGEYLKSWNTRVDKCTMNGRRELECQAPQRPRDSKIAYEITPEYSSKLPLLLNMRYTLPHWRTVKFLFNVREHVPRFISSMIQFLQITEDPKTFDDGLPVIQQGAMIMDRCVMTIPKYTCEVQTQIRVCLDSSGAAQAPPLGLPGNASISTVRSMPTFAFWLDNCKSKLGMSYCKKLGWDLFAQGLYALRLSNMECAGFSLDQIMVLSAGQIKSDPAAVLRDVAKFAGLAAYRVRDGGQRLGTARFNFTKVNDAPREKQDLWAGALKRRGRPVHRRESQWFMRKLLSSTSLKGNRMEVSKELRDFA